MALFRVVSLVIATGAGRPADIHRNGVLGGMLVGTFLAVFFVPLFFVFVRTFSQRTTNRVAELSAGLAPELDSEQS